LRSPRTVRAVDERGLAVVTTDATPCVLRNSPFEFLLVSHGSKRRSEE
jgi:hypothetical protein